MHLYLGFCHTDGAASIFHRYLLSQWKVDVYNFFPWLIPQKYCTSKRDHRGHATDSIEPCWRKWQRRRKKKKANRKATLQWLGFEPTIFVSRGGAGTLSTRQHRPAAASLTSWNNSSWQGAVPYRGPPPEHHETTSRQGAYFRWLKRCFRHRKWAVLVGFGSRRSRTRQLKLVSSLVWAEASGKKKNQFE